MVNALVGSDPDTFTEVRRVETARAFNLLRVV